MTDQNNDRENAAQKDAVQDGRNLAQAWNSLRSQASERLENLKAQVCGFTSDEEVARHEAQIAADESLLEEMDRLAALHA